MQVLADGDYFVDAHALVGPLSISNGLCLRGFSHVSKVGVRRDKRIAAKSQIGVHAGPSVVPRMFNPRSPQRIEFDVEVGGEQVAIVVDEAGFQAAFPWRSGAAVASTEGGDTVLPKLAHRARNGAALNCADEKLDMVAHQHICIHAQLVLHGAGG